MELLSDALRDRDQVRWEIDMESVIVQMGGPGSCQLDGGNRGSGEMHMQAVIERVWRCTWRP